MRCLASPIAGARLSLLMLLGVVGVAVAGCPTPAPGGQSDHCAVMMRCWYNDDAVIRSRDLIPVRFSDGELLSDADLKRIQDHFGEDGECWQDQDLATQCTAACVQALAANCLEPFTQCLDEALDDFDPNVVAGEVSSCEDPTIADAMVTLEANTEPEQP